MTVSIDERIDDEHITNSSNDNHWTLSSIYCLVDHEQHLLTIDLVFRASKRSGAVESIGL